MRPWIARATAAACSLAVSRVHEIWKMHGLTPHRWRNFKLSTDTAFVARLHGKVGLYLDPPAHAIGLSVDEKSQIQALDRIQPGLPTKAGCLPTCTHDYERHGTTRCRRLQCPRRHRDGRNMQRHRHQKFIRFLNVVEGAVPDGKVVHAIIDNYTVHW